MIKPPASPLWEAGISMTEKVSRLCDPKKSANLSQINVRSDNKCRDCEYKDTDEEHPMSGFAVCWGNRAEASPHILTLGQLGNINKRKDCINTLIAEGKSSVYDVPLSLVRDKYNNRPYYQVAKKDEFLLPEFGEVLKSIEYPLHFVDFETSQMAMPYHARMRPYQRVLFPVELSHDR